MQDSSNPTGFQKSVGLKVKLLMLGDTCVGKSSILSRFVEDKFTPNFISTLGVEYRQKLIELNGQQVQLQIWDTAGQERFKTITPIYYKSVDGVLLVYDIHDRATFENVEYWLQNLSDHADRSKISIVLAGNKVDVTQGRVVERDEAQSMAEKCGMKFYETSAKTNINITQVFQELTTIVLDKRKHNKKEIDMDLMDGAQLVNPNKTEAQKQQRKDGCCS